MADPKSTAVAKLSPGQIMEREIGKGAPRMAMLVPKAFQRGYDVQRQIMAFAIEATKNPQLLDCTPESVRISFYQAAALGLEIGSSLGHVYLVPYGKQCQMIPGYRGLIYAAVRSGACRQVWAETIHANDSFAIKLGTEPKIEHQPPLGDRGDIIGAYAVARLHGGGTQFAVLDLDEITRIRAASRAGKAGPWAQWFGEMAKKSAIRRLCKQLPISTDEQRATFLRAVAADAEIDGGASPAQVNATLGIAAEPSATVRPAGATDKLDAALGIDGGDEPFDEAESARIDAEQAQG